MQEVYDGKWPADSQPEISHDVTFVHDPPSLRERL